MNYQINGEDYHSFAVRREKYFFVPYLGGVIALCLLLRHRDRHRPVPFAVPIGTGIMLCLLLERNGVRYAL